MAKKKKKIFILLGNPDSETYSESLAKAYEEGAKEAGHEVRRVNLGDITFDPILHKGYKVIQELEPDLITIQKNIQWADHFVIVYPNWWNTMPALLKGFFDRAWIPGFAFNFDKETKKRIQHLKGKSARVIIVAGSHSGMETRLKYGDYSNEIRKGILEFAGFSPVKITCLGPSERVSDAKRDLWQREVHQLGRAGE